MLYKEALKFIHGTRKLGSKLGLSNITDLLERLSNPHKKIKSIHVAGTNGKGSVTSMITSILLNSGYKVGMFTSPYLERFTERIQVNQKEIPEEDLARITGLVKAAIDDMLSEGKNHPTEFEIVTAIGFCYFYEQQVDYAVVEVGLGGRLDSTNVVDPVLSVITSISYDHMDMLGDTLSQIAFEKGGIIKPGRPVVLYPQEYEASAVLRQIALERNSPLTEVSLSQVVLKKEAFAELVFDYHFKDMALEGITISLSGIHQVYNAATALTAIMMLIEMGVDISRDSIYNGLKNVRWPGRIEKVCDNPIIILDGAHNEAGALALSDAVTRYFKDKRINLLMGMLGDKDVKKVAEILCPLADSLILTRPDNPRAMEAEELYNIVEGYGIETHIEPDAEKAVEYGVKITDENSVLLISGSLYLIGQVRSILK